MKSLTLPARHPLPSLRVWIIALCASLLMPNLTSCDGDSDTPVNGYYETTDDDGTVLVLKGLVSWSDGFSVFKPDGFDSPFYILDGGFYGEAYLFAQDTATRLDAMTTVPTSWVQTVSVSEGATYWAKYITLSAYTYVRFRVALVEDNNVTIEYVVDSSESRPNTNANSSSDGDYATNWEMPALDSGNYYVEHTVTVDGEAVLNYALEWNDNYKHAEWVAFYFDKQTCQDVTSRTNAWAVDPLLPEEMQTDNSYHTSDGYDRGHLCASEDRVWLEEANEQTFYYSNMSPQISTFNQNYWADLETQVRTWGRAVPSAYDKVYVAKGGTLNNLLINFTGNINSGDGSLPTTDENGFTRKGLACPAYYFMAVLAEVDGTYQAIAFLVPHSEDLPSSPTAEELQEYVVSIDDLEAFSGLDLFCNLPDDIEVEVEASCDIDDWSWL